MINYFIFILLASTFIVGYVVGCLAMFGHLKKEIDYRDVLVTNLRANFLRAAR